VFTDPRGVLRGLTDRGLADFEALAATDFYRRAVDDRRIVGSVPADEAEVRSLGAPYVAALRHEVVPVVSYPYEWSFGMLRDAAILTLELTLEALDAGLAVKDASAYNVQFRGSRPVFIDVGSFEPARSGEPWYGYLQFCQQFLVPLMLVAHREIDVRPLLRGSIDGVPVDQAARIFGRRDLLRPGVLKHVRLHARLQRSYADDARGGSARTDLTKAGFSSALVRANLQGLLKVVRGLSWEPPGSTWSDYRSDNSYSDDDAHRKAEFVDRVCRLRRRRQVCDLGANDGHFAQLAADSADYVIAMDLDQLSVERHYRRLRAEGSTTILPLTVDLVDPSPGIGWRNRERSPLAARAHPDLVLALALVHHLAITRNVPLGEISGWLAAMAPEAVVELPLPEDPQVQRLLRNKSPHLQLDYSLASFELALAGNFSIDAREVLPSGRRVLYHLSRLTDGAS
jgi:ribosomal protein L11 methylase PrmA